MRNRTEHGFSRLTAISDAGSTPAASTNSLETSLAVRPFALRSGFPYGNHCAGIPLLLNGLF